MGARRGGDGLVGHERGRGRGGARRQPGDDPLPRRRARRPDRGRPRVPTGPAERVTATGRVRSPPPDGSRPARARAALTGAVRARRAVLEPMARHCFSAATDVPATRARAECAAHGGRRRARPRADSTSVASTTRRRSRDHDRRAAQRGRRSRPRAGQRHVADRADTDTSQLNDADARELLGRDLGAGAPSRRSTRAEREREAGDRPPRPAIAPNGAPSRRAATSWRLGQREHEHAARASAAAGGRRSAARPPSSEPIASPVSTVAQAPAPPISCFARYGPSTKNGA